jgi:predicted nucleotidyltransferase
MPWYPETLKAGGITEKLSVLEVIANKPSVEAIYLYGSRARGDFSPLSDVDFAINATHMDASEWLDILCAIEAQHETLLKMQSSNKSQLC